MDPLHLLAAIATLAATVGFLYRINADTMKAQAEKQAQELAKVRAELSAKQEADEARCLAQNEALMARVAMIEGKHTQILERIVTAVEKLTGTEIIRPNPALERHEPHDLLPTPPPDRRTVHG